MTADMVALIRRKREGSALTRDEIDWLTRAYTAGEVPDYQMSALMMAILWRGMTRAETVALTLAMADSGVQLHMRDRVSPVVDKHSTGGVGDKVTLAVGPLAASCGLKVAKMSGRGLGHTGGTVDKLESIPGMRMALSREEFTRLVEEHGIVIAGQSSDLAPADGKMYALRDVTATVESIPLIAASIMSKKLAIGPTHLLLDVKVGSGAFMKTEASARALAETMVRIGEDAGVRTVAMLSSMEQPLGHAIGNALEVVETINILRGEGPEDVTALCVHEVGALLAMTGLAPDAHTGEARAQKAITSGAGLAKLREVVAAQGGDPTYIDEPSKLPQAPHVSTLGAPKRGTVAGIHAEQVGRASVRLGAGRVKKGDPVDPAVGLVMRVKIGDRVAKDDPLIEIHARSAQEAESIHEELLGAFVWSSEPVTPPPLILGEVSRETLAKRRAKK